MQLKLGIEILEQYKRLSYKVWYALAEFVDNSTQSYINNLDVLAPIYEKEKTILKVEITYKSGKDGYIKIHDNSIGMDEIDLQKALTIGKPPDVINGRSKYGLGLKTAAFWFGDKWEIITKKANSEYEYHITIDLQELLKSGFSSEISESKEAQQGAESENLDVVIEEIGVENFIKRKVDIKLHYTTIIITKLNRNITPPILKKSKDYLRSIYRYDIKDSKLALFVQDDLLKWNEKDILDRLLKDDDTNLPYHQKFSFKVNEKFVSGWAGILETGSRSDGGFSLLQAKRVIQGWPLAYKPTLLFGDQEGGVNDLVNQRLFGELFLDGFDVSHTKDEILFSEDEEEILDQELFKILSHYKEVAKTYRKPKKADDLDIDFSNIVPHILKQLETSETFSYSVTASPVLSEEIIESSNQELYSRTLGSRVQDTYFATIANVKVMVIINTSASVYDPYLVLRIPPKKNELAIIVNRNHPHWTVMQSEETVISFIKHCIYDGLAEWKAIEIINSINPDTIKSIKDSYLREDLRME